MNLVHGNKIIELDNEGFLLQPLDWDEEVAGMLAQRESLELTEERWQVVRFVRDYYEKNQTVPEARAVLKFLRIQIGPDHANRKYLYRLFPYGYGQQACKIAGTRKPLKLMLDI